MLGRRNLLKLEFFYDELRYEEITYDGSYGVRSDSCNICHRRRSPGF